ncbi:amino acid adenylation domain-containing protein [Paenibacillus sp. PR3]|uniref:Amino acid adenylation domain-containing protein n=1 Tax=Paenibacillus terricola TaxID=2763503 RepID=A0ABR8MP85_9BACL|nr:non-ribosomal peptide synthetase [Paenibacillus terricola]MBD3917803.1 amino acid adenylation domain-containing protein [Paenibacillus terricola]
MPFDASNGQTLSGVVHEADRLFWRNLLGNDRELTRVPADSRKLDSLLAQYSLKCDEGLTALLHGRSGGSDYAMYLLVTGALALVTARYTNQHEVLLVTPVFEQTREGGMDNDLLVMPVAIGQQDNTRMYLNGMRDMLRGVMEHQRYPFDRLAREIGWLAQEEELLTIPIAVGYSKLQSKAELDANLTDLQFWFSYSADGQLLLELTYNAQLYSEAFIEQISMHWQSAVRELAVQTDTTLVELEWLPASDRSLVIEQWNATAGPFPSDATLHSLFEAQALRMPDAIAALCRDERISYRELDEWSNRIARTLRQTGAASGSRTAVLCSRSFAMVAAVLGILKAGGAYVPLDAAWPKRRLETVLQEVGATHIVTMKQTWEPVADLARRVRSIDRILLLDEEDVHAEPVLQQPDLIVRMFDDLSAAAHDRVSAGGFISAYTGLAYTEEEVNQYVNRIVELARPFARDDRRVLEVGCGSGLIMFELAPLFGFYVGLDPSPATQQRNEQIRRERGFANVSLLTAFADSMADMEAASFDLIMLPSVFQFFDGYRYAEKVMRLALRLLKPNGTILIADVPDEDSKEEFRISLEEFRRDYGMVYQSRFNIDQHLYASEAFFQGYAAMYPNVSIEIARRSGFRNELRYRYDVVMTLDGEYMEPGHNLYVTGGRIAQESADALDPVERPEDTAYVLFTSGSTGTPKGVVVTHRPVVNVIDWVNRTFGVDEQDRLFFITSLCFDLSVYDMFGMFAAGGAIDIVPEEDVKRPEGWLKRMAEAGITIWDSAPAALAQCVPYMERQWSELVKLRLALLSGDWIPLTLPGQLNNRFPGIRVAALGGATEACIWSNCYEVDEVDPAWASIPYGKPIRNARYYILDRNYKPCPIGAIGELYIGGDCLASGYHSEKLTLDRFIADPYSPIAGGVMYRTGDLAKWMRDGNMEFLGRTDHQVKIRGYRVELGEIQAKLLRYPGIGQCIVLDRADAAGVKSLCAYYVAEEEYQVRSLRDYLGTELPPYMIPSYFIKLASIPVTSNGKVDRSALPDPHSIKRPDEAYEPPANDMEAEIAELWKELLELDNVSVLDDFFEIGGHSLLAVKMELEMELRGYLISPEQFAQCRTIRDLAQHTTK